MADADRASQRTARLERLAFFGILLLGIGLRCYLAVAQPTPMLWFDTGNYVWGSVPGAPPFFDRPLGYSWLLRALRALSPDLRLVQLTQMTMGVLAALAFYAIARRLMPAPRGVALAALALTLIWPLNLIMETYVLAETPFLLLAALTILLLLSGIERRSPRLLVLSGILLGIATLIRTTGLILTLSLPPIAWMLARPRTPQQGRLRSWSVPAAVAVSCLVILFGYARFYHRHYGVWAIENWSGINRYSMLAPLIEPEDAGPDPRAAAVLRAHPDARRRDARYVMWDEASPLADVRRTLVMTTPQLNSWAEHTAFRAASRRPLETAALLTRNAYNDFTIVDSLDQQIPIDRTLSVQKATLAVYGFDTTGWERDHRFGLPALLALYRLKPLLVGGLLVSALLALIPRFRHRYQLILSANAASLVLAAAITVVAEQRHIQLAENLLVLNLALVGGQMWTAFAGYFSPGSRSR